MNLTLMIFIERRTMKIYKKRTLPDEYLDHRICDICKTIIDDALGNYDINETTIKHVVGQLFPSESDYTKTFEIDICSSCFINKIVPFLINLGVIIKYEDTDNIYMNRKIED